MITHLPTREFVFESQINLFNLLLNSAQPDPHKVYYYGVATAVSYGQMCDISLELGQRLLERIALSQKPILAVSTNNNEAVLHLTWACLASGICLAFLPFSQDPLQIHSLMQQIDAEVLVTDVPALWDQNWAIPYETLSSENAVHSERPHDPVSAASLEPDTPAFIFQTSGTTGEPKWIQVSHGQFLTAVQCMQQVGSLAHAVNQVVYITSPLSHSYGLSSLLEYTSVGASVMLPSKAASLGAIGALMDPTLANIMSAIEGVPHFYFQMARLIERIKLPALRHIGFGGGALNEETIRRISQFYPQLSYSVRYGMTETPSVVSHKLFRYPYDDDWKSSGKILPIYDLQIVDQAGQIVDSGQQGEIQIRGYCLAWPYYGEASSHAFFATGDIGYINAAAELCVVGRKSLYLKIRDYRISPEYIESVINTFADVLDCRVSEVHSRLLAEIVPANDALSRQQLLGFLAEKLPGYAIPETITFIEAVPRTASGKIKRH